ncbi:TIGR02099 family protein [Chromatium weissei]|nr:TIGR02099 family protein [Chromatium weissei]
MNEVRQSEQIRRIAAAVQMLVLVSLIVTALLFSAARLALPLIENYQQHFAELLSHQLGYQVSFNTLSLRLSGWQPRLHFTDFQLVKPNTNTPIFSAQALELDLDLLGSWRSKTPQFNHFTLISAQLNLRRNHAGQLSLLGFEALPLAQPEALARFLDQGQINLIDSRIYFIDDGRLNTAPLQLNAVNLQLHNAGWQHQLNVSARPPSTAPAPDNQLIINAEFTGAPAAFSTWDGTAHLHFNGDNFEKLLPLEWFTGKTFNSGALRLDGWLRIQAGRFEQALVHIALNQLTFTTNAAPFTVHQLQAQTRIRRQAAGGWQIEIADLNANHTDAVTRISKLNLNLLLGDDGTISRLDLIADQLELADLTALIRASPWASMASLAPLLAAQLHGRVSALKVLSDHTDTAQPWRWHATAALTQFGATLPKTTFEIDGLDAQLTADQNGGTLQLNSTAFTLNAPPHFRAPLAFNTLRGQLNWFRAPANDWQLVGREFVLANSDLNGDFQFELTLPANHSSPLLKLHGQLHDARIARIPAYLVTDKLPPPLLAWLDRSLRSGRISNAEVNLAGRLADYPFRDRSGQFDLRLDFADLELAYHANWPSLTQAKGVIQFHNQAIDIAVEHGRIYDSDFRNGAVHIAEPRGLQQLTIHGNVIGPFTDELRILRSTPLATKLGQLAEMLTVSGQSQLALKIDLPLVKTLPVGVTGELTWPQAATLDFKNTPIRLSALGGVLRFTEKSVHGDALTAQLWGQPLQLTLATEGNAAAARLHLRAQSKTPVTELARQIPNSLWASLNGTAVWNLTATLPPPGTTPLAIDYQLSSHLKGLAIKLPAPLGKTASTTRTLEINGTLIPQQRLTLVGRMTEVEMQLALNASRDGFRLTDGHVRIGKNAPSAPRQQGLWLLAQMKDLNLDEWLKLLQPSATAQKTKHLPKETSLGVNVRLDRVRLGDFRLHAVTLKRDPSQPVGELTVKADELNGRIRLENGANRPLNVMLERLNLQPLLAAMPNHSLETSPQTVTKRSSPLPSMEVQVANLHWGNASLGRLRLELRRSATGQRLSALQLDGNSLLTLHGTGEWLRATDGNGQTELQLTVNSSNLGALLQSLNEPAAVETGATRADLQLRWRGSFNAFAWQQAEGVIDLNIGSGRLPKVEPGLGRLLGVVNLAALNRRLTLDFSDLYGKGFSFERIHGKLNVNTGRVRMANFTIDGPAGRVLIDGLTDLVTRRFDQTVTVEPKLGSGIALASAVAGGPIVGAAVYLVDRIAGNLLDRLARYRYRVTGSWREPEFKRLGWEPLLLNTKQRVAPESNNHFLNHR